MVDKLPPEEISRVHNPELHRIFTEHGYQLRPPWDRPRQGNPLGAYYTKPTLLDNYTVVVSVEPFNDNYSLVTHWVQESIYRERGPETQGWFDLDGYPRSNRGGWPSFDGWEVAKAMGLMEPKSKEVIERQKLVIETMHREIKKIIPSLAAVRYWIGDKHYNGYNGWSDLYDDYLGEGGYDKLSQLTGQEGYTRLYLAMFDLQHENGRRLAALFEDGLSTLPEGGKFCRFLSRPAYFLLEGQLILQSETEEFSWAVLATKGKQSK